MNVTERKLLDDSGQVPGTEGVLQLYVNDRLLGEFPVNSKPLIIGRTPESDIVLADSAISRRHAKFQVIGGSAVVKDLGSAHGVSIDGQQILDHEIRSKGHFSVLQYRFRYLSATDYKMENKGQIIRRGAISESERSSSQSPTDYYGGQVAYGSSFDGTTLLADAIGIIRTNWRLIATFVAGASMLGLFHSFLAVPTYSTDALVQVEPKSTEIGGPFSDFENSRRISDALIDEIEIIQSRSILGTVVDDLLLSVKAKPSYFPFLGAAIARSRSENGPVKGPVFGLQRYAWSDESIVVDSMEIPETYIRQRFEIVARGNGAYQIIDSEKNSLARGRVGEPLTGWLPGSESSSLFVSELNANSGAVFTLTKIPRLEAIAELRDSLAITNAGDESSILRLSLVGGDPSKISDIVNGIVTTYVTRNVQQQSEDANRTLQFVEEQIPIAKAKMESAEASLSALRLQRGSVDLSRDTQVVLDKIVRLEFQISELERSRAQLIERFTPGHPRVMSVDAQLQGLNQNLAAAETEVRELPTTEREVLSVSREVAVSSALYVSLVNRAQELQVVSAYAATTGNVRVVDYASVALFPFRPNKPFLLVIYLMLGFLLCGGLILFRSQLRNVVRDPELIEARLNLPIYATLPHSARREATKGGDEDPKTSILAVANPTDPAIEGMRSLRTSLQFAFVNSDNNILLITGPTPRIGKTFVASNLAAVLAASGRSVVVIDADLRRGTLHEQFNLSREPGLADAIGGDVELSQVTHATNIDGLHVVTAGAIPPNPSELLMHDRFINQLAELSQQFDHVIIDSPPVLAVTDPVLLSNVAGVVLLVAKCGAHPMREIEQSVRQLIRVGANVRGIVFNDVPVKSGRVYGHQPYDEYTRS